MRKAFVFGLSLLASACSVGPDYQHPQLYHDQQLQQNTHLNHISGQWLTKDWYKDFQDPLLNRLIAQAHKQSPNVKIAIQKLRRARHNLQINAVNDFPMINAQGSYNYHKPSKDIGFTIDTDYYQLGFDAIWELDIWGGGRRQTESARALFAASSANLDNVLLSLTAEIASDYIRLRTIQAKLHIAEQNLKLQKDIYNIVSSKHRYGLTDNISLNQAKYTVETTQALIPELKKREEVYKNSLAILVGVLPETLSKGLEIQGKSLVRRRFDYNLEKLYQLPVAVVRTRPDVLLSEHQLQAQNAQIGVAIAQLYPNISLQGFLGWQALKIPDLVDKRSYMYNYSPMINLPLLHWGQLQNEVKMQQELTQEYFYQYQKSVLNAVREIRDSMVAVNEAYRHEDSTYQAAKAQQRATSLMTRKYKQGLIEYSDLMIAEQNLLQAQNTLAESNGQIYLDIIAFHKAVGGGYFPSKADETYKSSLLKGLFCKAR